MSSYKCWSSDLGIEEEDAEILAEAWMVAVDAVKKYVDKKFSDWESPAGPFNILVCECTPDGQRAGSVRKFNVEVNYAPQFFIADADT